MSRLRELWSDVTLTTPVIGQMMGRTKNAVIGQARKLKLKPRKTGWSKGRTDRPKGPPQPRPASRVSKPHLNGAPHAEAAPEPPFAALTLNGRPVTLLELEDGMCRRPFGDPQMSGFHYCGHPRRVDPVTGRFSSPYCPAHASQGAEGCHRRPVAWEKAWERRGRARAPV